VIFDAELVYWLGLGIGSRAGNGRELLGGWEALY
jgi:hypothetical protein